MPHCFRALLASALGWAALACGLLAANPASAQTALASSSFTLTNENWTVVGSGLPAPHVPQLIGPAGPGPGGYIFMLPGGTDTRFSAPRPFTGEQTAAIGGQLSFRMQVETGLNRLDGTLYVKGDGMVLTTLGMGGPIDLGSTTWVNRKIDIVEGSFIVGGTGQLATAQEIERVFRNIEDLSIQAASQLTASSTVFLDDVRLLSAVPEPATWALLTVGILAVGTSAARRCPSSFASGSRP